ncbi:LPS export ABC transporter periplasmic protein LptC [Lamprobacter modestohalophilus]|uniref:LPS export ABC transporter periplasmic protein LptC n=1 Tax=Lamprobacter modestohalophilus TaxID=1064514 RepID=UPI002ADEF01F|nr:LPS export ABC transporter periplasmic protein LptC [Lamprobacter modestohalophilus]MEA1050197.1 LPS export ABC transporter periplasmic protein LptC [Lamprobacter modestohalophilus]
MPLTQRELSLAALLIATGLAAWWWLSARDTDKALAPSAERRPDYVVEGLRAMTLGVTGEPERRLSAQRLRHYPDDGSSELDDPVLVVYSDDGPPLHARSALAWINARGDEILLEREVRLQRGATAQSAPVELRTSELLVLPEVDYAETADFVEIERAEDWITATEGMRAWLGETTRIQLFGRARAALVPSTDDDAG